MKRREFITGLGGVAALSDVGEASVGKRAGQPWSRDRKLIPVSKSANASAWATRRGRRPWHAHMLHAREPGDPPPAPDKFVRRSASGQVQTSA